MDAFARCITRQLGMRVASGQHAALADLLDADGGLLRWTGQPLRREQVEALAERLAIGETYFFREPAAFALLEHELLPALIASQRGPARLRLWSAGCCTGEEAWSLAIVAQRLLGAHPQADIEVLGTDIHPGFLARAAEGVYGDWSFRGAVPGPGAACLAPTEDGRWAVSEGLRRLVRFAHLNLAADHDAVGMDVILCRHVLMYFDAVQARRAVARLHRALVPGGWLIVGSAEANAELFDGFEALHRGDAMAYRKPLRPATCRPSHLDRVAPPTARPADDPRLAESIRRCETAIAADRCDASLHYRHALLLEQARQPGAARAALRRVLFLDRHFVPAHLALERLCESQGLAELARRHAGHAWQSMQEQTR